jgi:hypothetical protein
MVKGIHDKSGVQDIMPKEITLFKIMAPTGNTDLKTK